MVPSVHLSGKLHGWFSLTSIPARDGLLASNRNPPKLSCLTKKCSQGPFKRNLAKETLRAHARLGAHARTHPHMQVAPELLDYGAFHVLASGL